MKLDKLQGQTLSGRFRLDTLLGQGGYGAVFDGEQLSVGRRCAVKVLFPHLCGDDATVDRFRAEARATSRLSHPNSIILYDFGRDDEKDLLFLAMELLDGRDLSTLIHNQGTLSVEQTVHVTVQMAASLQEAHNLGLVHRDIKPRNIMLLDRGNDPMFVKVIDFGIAKVVNSKLLTASDLTQTGTIIGTPKYMAPEQIRNAAIDGRTDMYAVAMTVYKMLTGRTPFEEGTGLEIAGRQIAEAPEPVSTFHPGLEVSDAFEQVLLKALAKDPVDRFVSVAAFAQALVDASAGVGGQMLQVGMTPTSMPRPTDTLPDDTPAEARRAREVAAQHDTGPVSDSGQYSEITNMPVGTGAMSAPLPEAGAGVERDGAGSDSGEEVVEQSTGGLDAQTAEDFGEKTMATLAIPNAARPEAGEGTNRAGNTAEVDQPVEAGASDGTGERSAPSLALPKLPARFLAAAVVLLVTMVGGIAWYSSAGDGADESAQPPASPQSSAEDPATLTAVVAGARESDQLEPGEGADPDSEGAQAGEDDQPEPAEQAGASGEENVRAEAADGEDTEPEPEDQAAEAEPAEQAEPAASDREEKAPERPVRRPRRSIEVRVIPWGTLYVNGREVGEGTRHTLRLREGRHRMMLKQDGQVRARRTVDVSGRSSKIIELVAR